MKGASSWLTTLPLKSEIFDLNKSEFYEALSLRYCWTPKYFPSTYPCCKRFDVRLTLIMQCRVWKWNGGTTKWETCWHLFSRTYAMVLRSKLDTTKRQHYNQRIIEVEHGSFSPLVFSPYGGNGREAVRFLTELAVKRSQKKKTDYSIGIHWLWAIVIEISSVMCKRLQNNQIWVEHWL